MLRWVRPWLSSSDGVDVVVDAIFLVRAVPLLADGGRICVSPRLMILFHSGECASFTNCGKVALNVAVVVGMSLKMDPSKCSASC